MSTFNTYIIIKYRKPSTFIYYHPFYVYMVTAQINVFRKKTPCIFFSNICENWQMILNWLEFLCSIVEDDQLTWHPFQFTRIVSGIELILVLLRIVFSSEFILFVSNLFCRYTRDSKRKYYLFLKLSVTSLALVQQTIYNFLFF